MDHIFDIEELYCGYLPGQPVLHVPRLSIPRGKLVFIVGVSGGGKSTLLETLGLMNRTIDRLDGHCNFLPENDAPVALDQLWQGPSTALDLFRKTNYSFIFQKTNLIPNFTCGENMMLPTLFKGGAAAGAEQKVKRYMDRIGLSQEVFDKHIMEVSGGQRQRLAFIRAMCAEFTVLFGDEPTGNLDANTAIDVLTVLTDYLAAHGRTGILVSHDINLATQFADIIIPIELRATNGEDKMGYVDEAKIMYREPSGKYSNGAEGAFTRPFDYLKELIAG